MNYQTTATISHAKAILSVRRSAGLLVTTCAPCPAPSSDMITPSWVPDAAVIVAMKGVTS